MPRKSVALRLSQSQELYASYQEANIEEAKSGCFIRDMVSRLERGKGLSKGQRNWLDSLIEEGIPQSKGDPVLLAAIDEAFETSGMEQYQSALFDFRRKVFNGWDLSPKQAKWLSNMISDAKELRINGPWIPDEETIKLMRDLSALSKGYDATYWANHGGTYRAVEKIRSFIFIFDEEYETPAQRTNALASIGLDEWCINKAKKGMAGRYRELREKPYALAGALVWTKYRADDASYDEPYQWFQAPVCGRPEVSERGEVVYPILNPVLGLIEVTKDNIAKRKPTYYKRDQ